MVAEWNPEMKVARVTGPSLRTLALVMVYAGAGSILSLVVLVIGMAMTGSGYLGSTFLTATVGIGALCAVVAVASELVSHYWVRKRELHAGYTTSTSGPVKVPQVDPQSNRVIRSGGEAYLDPDEYWRRLALARQSALRELSSPHHGDGARQGGPGIGDEWTAVVKDGLGQRLADGDTVVLITPVKLKNSSTVVEAGTRLVGIRLDYGRDDDRVVSVNISGVGKLVLRSRSVKKI